MSFGDKVKNKTEELVGKAKEKTGETTGDKSMQAEGQTDQAKSNIQQAGEKIKDFVKK